MQYVIKKRAIAWYSFSMLMSLTVCYGTFYYITAALYVFTIPQDSLWHWIRRIRNSCMSSHSESTISRRISYTRLEEVYHWKSVYET